MMQEMVSGSYTRSNTLLPRADALVRLPCSCHNQPAELDITSRQLTKGVILIGDPGCGKTTAVCSVLKQLRSKLAPGDLLAVYDPKSEFADSLGRKGDILLGGSEAHAPNVRSNIFSEALAGSAGRRSISVGALRGRLHAIALGIIPEENKSDTQPYFIHSARRALEIILEACLLTPALLPELCNEALLQALGSEKFLAQVIRVSGQGSTLQELIGSGSTRNIAQQNVYAELLLNAQQTMMGFNRGAAPDAEKFSIVSAVHSDPGGRAVFLQNRWTEGGMTQAYAGLLVQLLVDEWLTYGKGRKLYLVLDEFSNLGAGVQATLTKALSLGRSAGICLICTAQNVSMLKEKFKTAQSMLASFQTKLLFLTTDAETRGLIKHLCGKVRSQTLNFYPGVSLTSGAVQETDAVTDTELMDFDIGTAVYTAPGQAPCIVDLHEEGC